VTILIDGEAVDAFAGESLLIAMLSQTTLLRTHEADGSPRAGFCLMGACQDCWVWLEDGHRLRACTTPVTEGLSVVTRPPAGTAHV
jgi:aerobic-type carbon monoxide dehydrogenase small subunit (CoxS/CutS family)